MAVVVQKDAVAGMQCYLLITLRNRVMRVTMFHDQYSIKLSGKLPVRYP
jgi:hypothetical protein